MDSPWRLGVWIAPSVSPAVPQLSERLGRWERVGLPRRHVDGRRAEMLVAELLEERGFTILARNLRLGHLEIDLVARQDELVVMVEVRARGSGAFERPLESLASSKKRMHLIHAADRLWRLRVSKMKDVERFRIDAASVDLREEPPEVHYVEGALTR